MADRSNIRELIIKMEACTATTEKPIDKIWNFAEQSKKWEKLKTEKNKDSMVAFQSFII